MTGTAYVILSDAVYKSSPSFFLRSIHSLEYSSGTGISFCFCFSMLNVLTSVLVPVVAAVAGLLQVSAHPLSSKRQATFPARLFSIFTHTSI